MNAFYRDACCMEPHEPWGPRAAQARLRRLRPKLPRGLPDQGELVPSNNNDVWRFDDFYLRVAWRGDRARLAREADLLVALGGRLPLPEVLDVGGDRELSWSLARAAPGVPLEEILSTSPSLARHAMRDLARCLRELHGWSPDPELARRLRLRSGQDGTDPVAVVGADVVPVPAARALALVPLVRVSPFADASVVDVAAGWLDSLGALDLGPEVVIHGDVYLGNVLVADGQISALLDFEFARFAPVDLELISFVRALEAEALAGVTRPPLVDWLREDYPEMFAAPDLHRRLWLYALAYALRQIIFWPPEVAEGDGLDPTHPLHTLRRLVEKPPV